MTIGDDQVSGLEKVIGGVVPSGVIKYV